jgi:redox-sensitive bicupin YhaK (pirin superfamily)
MVDILRFLISLSNDLMAPMQRATDKETAMKKVQTIHRGGERHWVGDGFPVQTVFSYNELGSEMTPFLLLDHAGPAQFEPSEKARGVDWHPHRGFETVTIVYEGEVDHGDTAGNEGSIRPGDVQWMTAGSGLLHKEFHGGDFARKGGHFEVAQLWVNLPAKSKMIAPRYQPLTADGIPSVALPGGGSVRVIAGEFRGTKGPAKTFTRINLLDVKLNAGQRLELDLAEGDTTGIYVLKGEVKVNGKDAGGSDLVVLEREGTNAVVEARKDAVILVMNGEPIDEPIAGYGPFVMNTQHEIQQAIADLRSGRMGRIPAHAR